MNIPFLDLRAAYTELKEEVDTAVAEVLFGDVNPSGKLPVTFEKNLEDRSSFDNYHDDDGDKRVKLTDGIFTGYRHHDRNGVKPRFPFGFGLSYTTFEYADLTLNRQAIAASESVDVSVEVANTGDRDGDEVVQLYISDVHANSGKCS